MRKFCLMAILPFALLACNRPEVKEPSREIGFASQTTRAIVEGKEDLYTADIKIFGTLNVDGTILRLFDAEKLYYNSALADWDYDNTRYWTPQLEHRFCALWPYDTACTFSDNEAVVTINHTAEADGADLLYAVASRTPINDEDYSAVSLNFNHACAAVQFNIINASDREVYSVSNIYLVGLKNKGAFTFGVDGSAEWSLDDSVVDQDDYSTYGGRTDLQHLPVDLNQKQSLYTDGAIIVLPQEIVDTDVKIHFEITKQATDSPEAKEIMLGQIGGSAPKKWEAGKRYEYTMTITENSIVSNVKVVPWVDYYVDL